MVQYALLYCLIDVAILAFALSIYFYITQDFGSEEETFRFKLLVGAFVVYLLSDIVLGAVYSGEVYLSFYPNMIVVYTNIVSLGLVSFLWYRYALLRLSPALDVNNAQVVVSSIPIIFMIILASGSAFNGWAFELEDGGGFRQGDWYIPMFLAGAVYLVVVSIMSALRYVRAKGSVERANYFWLSLFLVPPIIAVAIEVMVPKTPVMAIGVYMAIHLSFFSYQSRRIHNDALTGLNNRRRIDAYIESHFGNTEMDLFLFDINRFKQVNDRFGHYEGDRALCDVAEALRIVCANRQAIAARYGGDEFAVVIPFDEENKNQGSPQAFIDEVRAHITARAEARNLSYPLTVSAGYTHIPKDDKSIKSAFEAADRALYADKAIWHKRIQSV